MRTMQCIYTIGDVYTIWNMITTIEATMPQRHPLHNLDAVRDAPDADNALIVLRIYAYYDTCTSHAG